MLVARFLPLVPLLLLVAGPAAAATARDPGGFDAWVDRLTTEWTRDPNAPAAPGATGRTVSAGEPAAPTAEAEDADQITFEGIKARRDRHLALAREGLRQLGQWPASTLTSTQRISASMLRWQLERVVDAAAFEDFENMGIFRQLRGLHVSAIDSLTARATLRRPADVERYLQRLDRIAPRIDEGLALTRQAAANGYVLPRFILERVQVQLEMFLDPAPEANLLVVTLEQRTSGLTGLSAAARDAALARARDVVRSRIRPAYQRLLAFVTETLPRAATAAGWNRLPRGDTAYAQQLRYYTTTALRAEEIHALGLREVARLEAEAEPLLRQVGANKGTFAERLARATTGPLVTGTPDPRAAILARYNELIRDAEKRSSALFNLKPRAPVEVRRVPPLTERVSSAYYSMPPADGSRPGIFWVPLPGEVFYFRAGMRTLAYHEAVPGHHFQLALQAEQKDLPRFRARRTFGGISAHSEGWGLYAERLAVEQGWYEGDPFGRLGALSSELFRARRLVVDTGLHTQGWSRQQAINYGISASEVERYLVNPGQACSYLIGQLRILELREQARAALGPRFSLPDFHDVILKTGAVPLDVLADVVREWAASRH